MADAVNHPNHYNTYKGLEIIDLVEQMNFNRGNAVKYIARAGLKNSDTEIEDLKKAVGYIQREIKRINSSGENEGSNDAYEKRIDAFDLVFRILHEQLGIPRQQVRELMNTIQDVEHNNRKVVAGEVELTEQKTEDFENMMLAFIGEVLTRPASLWTIIMNSHHLNFIREFHQKNQRARIYRGGDDPHLLGVPILIDETITKPKLV